MSKTKLLIQARNLYVEVSQEQIKQYPRDLVRSNRLERLICLTYRRYERRLRAVLWTTSNHVD